MIVSNALYFKGQWLNAFSEDSTTIKCFHTTNKDCIHVEMMQNVDTYKYSYIQDLQSHVVDLPYDDGKYAMLLIIPKEMNFIRTLLKDLQHTRLSTILKMLEKQEIQLSLPKFEIDFETDLVPALKRVSTHCQPTLLINNIIINNNVCMH